MKGAKIIIQKELTRVFKDKKLVFSLFVLPAVMMIGIYSLIGFLIGNMEDDVEQHISQVYVQNAPEGFDALVKESGYGETAQIEYLEAGEDTAAIQDSIRDGDAELLIVFEEDFLEKIAAYQSAGDAIPEVAIYYTTSGNYSTVARDNLEAAVLSNYEKLRLGERIGNLEQLTVFNRSYADLVDENKMGGEVLGMMLPYLITFMLFVGAMSLGVDAITGEKERGTMASMLLTPVKRQEIVLGKLVSLSILSSISAVVYAVSMIAAMPIMLKSVAGDAELPFSIEFSAVQVIQLIVIMLAMVYLYVALVSLVAVLARTAKEANTYVSPIYIIVLVAGMLTMYQGGIEKSLASYAIPIYGNAIAIQNLLLGELTLVQFGLSVGGTVLAALILTACITKAFNSEKVMFNA
ncbi:MAG: ABC transporter permease [Lachnospiraceae bacterium]|nr:ABC transporter permease [Lachnospiraceae bacterium]